MEIIKQNIIQLAKYLFQKEILDKDLSENVNDDIEIFLTEIKTELRNKFPNTKIKFKMRSIHYANAFKDEKLKLAAFILDDIEEILCFNGFSNHNKNVEYFNQKITQKNFEISPENLVKTSIDCLMLDKEVDLMSDTNE